MVETRVRRRLAAVLAADVAGYSRLMGADEEGTLAALKALRRELIVDSIVLPHHLLDAEVLAQGQRRLQAEPDREPALEGRAVAGDDDRQVDPGVHGGRV